DGDFNKVLKFLTLLYVNIHTFSVDYSPHLCNIIDLQLSSIWCIICFIGFPLDQSMCLYLKILTLSIVNSFYVIAVFESTNVINEGVFITIYLSFSVLLVECLLFLCYIFLVFSSDHHVVKLYERCLVACANYPEYWIRYVLSMGSSGSMDLADNALTRATQVFVKRQPEIHLFAARLKEQNGDIAGARAAFQLLHSEISPGLLEAVIKHANMEQRLGNVDDAFSVYEQVIAVEKGKDNSILLPLLYAQYSRFSYLVLRDAEKARKIIVEALDHVQPSKHFMEALIFFETILPPPRKIEYLDPLIENLIKPNVDTQNTASSTEREELSLIYIEFLGLFGDVESIKRRKIDIVSSFYLTGAELKKRSADEFLSSDRTKLAKTYNETAPAQPVSNAYPNAPAQWSGASSLATTTSTPAQPQQWNPAYGQQQAAYGAYGGYPAGYAAPQAPTPVPQAAAYGAYPPQAYPAAATAPLAAPVQQPAAAPPQAYYNTYY
ncbi:LOW QUALITY PROTEIN: hypothetical protein HID58_031354, partial [Brassica napus]